MSQFETIDVLEGLRGKLSGRSNTILRRKTYRLPNGKVAGYGPKEAYEKRRRDYSQNPLTAAEALQRERWRSACREASVIIHDASHPRYAELYSRWESQLSGAADVLLGKRVIVQFGNFVRAVLLREKKD